MNEKIDPLNHILTIAKSDLQRARTTTRGYISMALIFIIFFSLILIFSNNLGDALRYSIIAYLPLIGGALFILITSISLNPKRDKRNDDIMSEIKAHSYLSKRIDLLIVIAGFMMIFPILSHIIRFLVFDLKTNT